MKPTAYGKSTIRFEYDDNLKYPFSSYRKYADGRFELYNVTLTHKDCVDVANRLPQVFRDTQTLPHFQLLDENGYRIMDTKWDNLRDFVRF